MTKDNPRLLIASNNPGKLREYHGLFSGVKWELVLLGQLSVGERDFECGTTFEENAVLKAKGYFALSRLPTLADDSGLEVDALGGRPGVHSARYGGLKSDQERVQFLLHELSGVPWEKRTARFRCVIAVVSNLDEAPELFQGACQGIICTEPRGSLGFGYDPVFFFPELGKTMAELAMEEKNRVSHRAKAAHEAFRYLQELARK
ncbi:MAG: RdgB/HAM1 family non-canonical purine NTP pyrophosphatase [Chloroflexi bacterium]|nr:RdgB/HAM1 family non-canonical purine NTP pyrophosphatase [Chloroflexota bacterium]